MSGSAKPPITTKITEHFHLDCTVNAWTVQATSTALQHLLRGSNSARWNPLELIFVLIFLNESNYEDSMHGKI